MIQKLSANFIPVISAMTDPSFTRSVAGRWFTRAANAHKEPGGHYQGFYILTADGYGPLRQGPSNAEHGDIWNPAAMIKFMDRGLAMTREHTVVSEGVADLTDDNLRADYIALPDPTTSVIRQYSRILNIPLSDLNSSPDRDYLWVYQKEVADILSRARGAKGDFALPSSFVARLVRFHLVDNLGGRTNRFTGVSEVKKAAFYARVDSADPAHFTFVGNWECRNGNDSIGIDGKIAGDFTLDTTARLVTRFRASADATAWGGGKPGHTEMPPPGKFPISFAFVETKDALGRGVPPSFAYDPAYEHAWFWTIPGESRPSSVEPSLPMAPILNDFVRNVEKTIGKPQHIGAQRERYYKAKGFVRIIIKPNPNSRIGFIEFQFARKQIKDWQQALEVVGLYPAGGEDAPPSRHITFRLTQVVPGFSHGWIVHWNTPSKAGNDTLILERVERK